MRALLLLWLCCVGLLLGDSAHALPMYAQRSGRTCANCHESPTYEDPDGWEDPALAWRKCSLSCGACHVDPSGGGLRNAAGVYYGQSTLPALPTQERGYGDLDRELLGRERVQRWLQRVDTPARAQGDRHIPSSWQEVQEGLGQGQVGNLAAVGRPLTGPSRMALWDGRYDDLNADPLLRVGGDLRGAWWSGNGRVFPMQADLHAGLHPVEHLSVVGTLAARGRSSGAEAVVRSSRSPVFLRRAFLMLHELPFYSWVKAGAFMPAFGTYIDDHTAFSREYVELDPARSDSVVHGVEVGASPNYPVVTVSAFRTGMFDPEHPDGDGWGAAATAGWRDLAWSLVGSGMVKRRAARGGRDLEAAALSWGFNPFALYDAVPLTYMGEVVLGRGDGPVVGTRTPFSAWRHELWWTVANGLVARFELDLGDAELGGPSTTWRRLGLGLDLVLVPGLTLDAHARHLAAPGDDPDVADVIVQTHLWF
ncbi:MAG: hypothetical protein D6798_01120 [Deltaproteobacteria bacterium]|nr:MAG: hypothetical protein D6798_01120 [Deltaproteobacteria bacterium]